MRIGSISPTKSLAKTREKSAWKRVSWDNKTKILKIYSIPVYYCSLVVGSDQTSLGLHKIKSEMWKISR